MRRGHPNAGGWRGENQRHFRPRGSGGSHFRPSRPYGPQETPRYPPPNARQFRRPRSYNHNPAHVNDITQSEHRDRNHYRINNAPRSQDRGHHNHDRQLPPYNQTRHKDNNHGGSYGDPKYYSKSDQYHVNNLGDIDHRHPPYMQNKDSFGTHSASSWANPPFDKSKQYYGEHRSPHKTPRRYQMSEDAPLPDYSGHRPPASDHYTATTSTSSTNSQYTHSVDDTVDIVRKRLMNRDKPQSSDSLDHQSNMDEDLRINTTQSYQNPPQEQPAKKKIQRHNKNIKLNCDKMKTKIVHQLFKMDKDKIHKLMDNPSSSSKFEYAISSLITEGQNSLNKHLRSAAEKSLYNSSDSFIQDNSNTIYEDTFMKQMQGVLDPQDTVLLEDIKPIVMAELSRFLQLDDYQLEGNLDQAILLGGDPSNYPYTDTVNEGKQYSQEATFDQNEVLANRYDNMDDLTDHTDKTNFEYENHSNYDSKPLFERRPPKNLNHNEESHFERRQSRHSVDIAFGYLQDQTARDSSKVCEQPIPLFDSNTDQLSEDEDPFAELDKQYHVAVDHNFIEDGSRATSPQQSYSNNSNQSPNYSLFSKNIEMPVDVASEAIEIKKEINIQTQNITTSPVKPFSFLRNKNETESKTKSNNENIKEIEQCIEKENILTSYEPTTKPYVSEEIARKELEKKEISKESDKTTNTGNKKSILQSNTRKRSTDQKPSHRKEKRKKSTHSECEESKPDLSVVHSNETSKEVIKDEKKYDSDKVYSDKYVRRKEPHKKAKEKVPETPKPGDFKKIRSNSTSSLNDSINNETPSKSDAKIKLKTIDMFMEQPKKGSVHQAHRNTAPTAQNVIKSPNDNKPKPVIPTAISFARKLSKRHIGTQIVLKVRNKESQTEKCKQISIETQTDPISNEVTNNIATNPLERMKDIDMEIQKLLQEKFKLYNSLETKSMSVPMDTIPSLSMRIFQMETDQVEEKCNDSEDTIVDEFTSIPAEELEQIAMEAVEKVETPTTANKKTRRGTVLERARKSSQSPSTKKGKKAKTPNISLIEQIITDDRPIEDIISLDDLESTPLKTKKRSVAKKKSLKKPKPLNDVIEAVSYDIQECSVVLQRIDISPYICLNSEEPQIENYQVYEVPVEEELIYNPYIEPSTITDVLHVQDHDIQETTELVEETVGNDLQFDMLDVSEDIIIGDSCEIKAEDKSNERVVSEDIILDNSQSSLEDTAPAVAEGDTECLMFDYSTNESLMRDAITVTGNADAVLAIECIDNDFIAACLDGNVYHFSGDGQLLNTLRGSNLAVTCLTIVKEKYETTVYTGSLDSRIRYYDLETGLEKGPECNVLSPIQTMDRAWDTVFVGTRTGFVLQFECKNNMLIPVSTIKFSEQSILALRALKEGPRKVLLVAARSENVTVKDAQTGLLLRTLAGPKMTVYTLLFEDGKVYCGTSSHNVHVFDYASGAHAGVHAGGAGAVCLRARGGLVFAGCYDGAVYVFREGAPRAAAVLRGPSLMLLSLAVRDNQIIAGYKDRSLYIWKIPLAILQEMVL